MICSVHPFDVLSNADPIGLAGVVTAGVMAGSGDFVRRRYISASDSVGSEACEVVNSRMPPRSDSQFAKLPKLSCNF